MTLRERLEQLVRTAPRGTLIPVEGLAGLIQTAADEETDLDVEDIGRLAATLLPNVMGITLAIEPEFCGGLRRAHQLLQAVNRIMFEDTLLADDVRWTS